MNICVFDTETTSLEKPFCYNIGYVIADSKSQAILVKHDYVVEQVWHNPMLFTTAYYANKRPIYVDRMRVRKAIMDKFGYICQTMIREFKNFNVEHAYAFNSPFDDKVFRFNCDWFKCNNPFDNIAIHDIRGIVHKKLALTKEYQEFCNENQRFTENGNYSTTAETVFQFMAQDTEFKEEHTALSDSEIEFEILVNLAESDNDFTTDFQTYASIPRRTRRVLTIINMDGEEFEFDYYKKTENKKTNTIKLK